MDLIVIRLLVIWSIYLKSCINIDLLIDDHTFAWCICSTSKLELSRIIFIQLKHYLKLSKGIIILMLMEYFKTVMHKSKSVVSVGVETWLEAVQSLGEWWVAMRPKVDLVSLEKFKSSRCIVHLLSWFLLLPQTHQLISWTVFRQKQLWATYWEMGCEGAGS